MRLYRNFNLLKIKFIWIQIITKIHMQKLFLKAYRINNTYTKKFEVKQFNKIFRVFVLIVMDIFF